MAFVPKNLTVVGAFGKDPTEDRTTNNLKNYDLIRIFKRDWMYSESQDSIICVAPLTKPFTYTVSPQYTTFGNVVYKDMGLDSLGKKLRSLGDYSAMTKRKTFTGNIEGAKLYKNVADMSYSFDFRMIEGLDEEGNLPADKDAEEKNFGISLRPLFYFNYISLQSYDQETRKAVNELFSSLGTTGDSILGKVKTLWSVAKGTAWTTFNSVMGGIKDSANSIWKDVEYGTKGLDYPSDQFAYRTENTIDIQVSNIGLLRNMILTNFSAQFSREVLENGLPVYIDYSISVSPIVQPTMNEVNQRYLHNIMNLEGVAVKSGAGVLGDTIDKDVWSSVMKPIGEDEQAQS